MEIFSSSRERRREKHPLEREEREKEERKKERDNEEGSCLHTYRDNGEERRCKKSEREREKCSMRFFFCPHEKFLQ